MPDRADYLAKTLIARLRSLDAVLREDAQSEATQARRRLELVEKVLAIEAGTVDGSFARTVLAALPAAPSSPRRASSDQDMSAFAAFLRERLPAD